MRPYSKDDIENALKRTTHETHFNFVLGDGGVQLLARCLSEADRFKNVRCLNLGHNMLSERASETLGDIVRTRNLIKLDLSRNALDDKGVITLAQAMILSETLVSVDFSGVEFGQQGTDALCKLLRASKSLQEVFFGSCKLGDDCCVKLAEVVIEGQTLTRLDLSNNLMTSAGFVGVVRALRHNRSLKAIKLCNCLGNAEGSMILGSILETDTILEELDIDGCKLGDAGIVTLTSSLRWNKTLKSLRMFLNCETDGMIAVGNMLKVNVGLLDINMTRNESKKQGTVAILESLKQNKTLKCLTMDFVESTAVLWHDMLQVNTSLKKVRLFGKMSEADEVCVVSALRDNSTLSHLWLPPVWSSNVTSLCLATVESNSTILFCGGELVDVCSRNRKARKIAKMACLTIISIRKIYESYLSALPKELVRLIAKLIWLHRSATISH